jgi:hypothetical protein
LTTPEAFSRAVKSIRAEAENLVCHVRSTPPTGAQIVREMFDFGQDLAVVSPQ